MAEGELVALAEVTALTATSMWYAHVAASSIPAGKLRLFSFIPIIVLLPFLPWYFSTLHLRLTSTFLLVWLAPFKLVLLAFDLGPLSPSLPLFPFIAAASLHIKLKPSLTHHHHHKHDGYNEAALKVLTLSILIALYQLKQYLPSFLPLWGYCLHLYLSMDIILSSSAFVAAVLLNLDLEPQFHAPLTSTSLQDFWGRRWNLIATDILRPAVYQPVRRLFGRYMGIMAAFVVSGVMHEVLFYYLTEERPSGEALGFFVLQGMCTVLEVKGRRDGGWRWVPHVHMHVVRVAAVGFVMVTCYSLLFPPLLRNRVDEVVVAESEAVLDFLGGAWFAAIRWLYGKTLTLVGWLVN